MAGRREERELLDLLDACTADVRGGRKTIERCLDEHAPYRSELAELLPVAAAIRTAQVVPPHPAHKLLARYRLVEELHRTKKTPLFAFLRGGRVRRRFAAIVLAAALAVCGSGAAVVVAQDAQPNDPLYGLKIAVEQQQVALAGSPEVRAKVRIYIAERRLAEFARAIAAGKEDAAVAAAAAYGDAMQRAYDDIEAAQQAGQSAREAADESLARVSALTAEAHTAGEPSAVAALITARERAGTDRPRTRPEPQPTELEEPQDDVAVDLVPPRMENEVPRQTVFVPAAIEPTAEPTLPPTAQPQPPIAAAPARPVPAPNLVIAPLPTPPPVEVRRGIERDNPAAEHDDDQDSEDESDERRADRNFGDGRDRSRGEVGNGSGQAGSQPQRRGTSTPTVAPTPSPTPDQERNTPTLTTTAQPAGVGVGEGQHTATPTSTKQPGRTATPTAVRRFGTPTRTPIPPPGPSNSPVPTPTATSSPTP